MNKSAKPVQGRLNLFYIGAPPMRMGISMQDMPLQAFLKILCVDPIHYWVRTLPKCQGGTVMAFPLNGKSKKNISRQVRKKKISPCLNFAKNVEILQPIG